MGRVAATAAAAGVDTAALDALGGGWARLEVPAGLSQRARKSAGEAGRS